MLNSYPNFSNARIEDARSPRFLDLPFAFYGRGDLEILRRGALLELEHLEYFSRRNLESAVLRVYDSEVTARLHV